MGGTIGNSLLVQQEESELVPVRSAAVADGKLLIHHSLDLVSRPSFLRQV
jgi:hypothetical protein